MSASPLRIETRLETLELKAPLQIAGRVIRDVPVLVVTLRRGDAVGRGEAAGVPYLGDTPELAHALIHERRGVLATVSTRQQLQALLPRGGARNAMDCALWALEAVEEGASVAELAGVSQAPLLTTFTLGAENPGAMARAAVEFEQARALKLKLTGDAMLDTARIHAVRHARQDVWLGVDANQSYTPETVGELYKALMEARVSLLEQPLARGREADMSPAPIPTAADESCQDLAELEMILGRFDVVNIKLDKCGGLTEALAMARRARELGLGVMVGNMIGTSLAMAPAMVVGQLCDLVDLDGPLPLFRDRSPPIRYLDGRVYHVS